MAVHDCIRVDERSALLAGRVCAPLHECAVEVVDVQRLNANSRSLSDPALRRVIASQEPITCSPRPPCRVYIADKRPGGDVLEHPVVSSYARAPTRGHAFELGVRWVVAENPGQPELAMLSAELGLDARHALGTMIFSRAPCVDVQDGRRVVTVIEAPRGDEYARTLLAADGGSGFAVVIVDADGWELRSLVSGALRTRGSPAAIDVLCAAAGALLERYFAPLGAAADSLDETESVVLRDTEGASDSVDVIREITCAKRSMLDMRRRLWPLRRGLTRLTLQLQLHPVRGADAIAVRTLSDHVANVLDLLEVQRDAARSLLDIHLGAQNNRIQLIMKRIAVVTTIFVPLTFLTGLEGTNFHYMPELDGKYSYPVFLGVIALLVVMMVIWFRRRRWL